MSDFPPAAPPKINLLASTLDLLHEVQVLRTALDKQIDRLDRLEKEIRALIAFFRGSAWVSRAGAGGGVAGSAAFSLVARPLPDDSVVAQVDAGEAFRLPPLLGALLRYLAAGGETSADEPAGWKSREEIAVWLATKTGRQVRRQYVNNLVSRLRARFTKARVSSAFIQTHRVKGVRLALKGFGQVTDGDV